MHVMDHSTFWAKMKSQINLDVARAAKEAGEPLNRWIQIDNEVRNAISSIKEGPES